MDGKQSKSRGRTSSNINGCSSSAPSAVYLDHECFATGNVRSKYFKCRRKLVSHILYVFFATSFGLFLPDFSNFSLTPLINTAVTIPSFCASSVVRGDRLERKTVYASCVHCRSMLYLCWSTIISTGSILYRVNCLIASRLMSANFHQVDRSSIVIHYGAGSALYSPNML